MPLLTLFAVCLSSLGQPQGTDVLRSHMDMSVDPGVDFFEYANGGWLRTHPIPASESSYGISTVVEDDLDLELRAIAEVEGRGRHPRGSDEQKVGDFWAVAMDEKKAEALGLRPLQPMLDRIGRIASTQDALSVAFDLYPVGVGAFFDFGISQDEKKSDRMAVHLEQGGLGLPDRDYYFNPEAGVAKIRAEYVGHLGRVLVQSGVSPALASARAAEVMAFETALASSSRKMEDLRDPLRNYNRMTPSEVTHRLTPSISWSRRLANWSLHPSFVVVGQPEFLSRLETVLRKTPVAVLRDYLRCHLISGYAPYLSKALDDENFRFYHQELTGQKERKPRWKRVINSEDEAIGFVLGRIFVRQRFSAATKKRYNDLVEAIRSAYSARIDRLEWMSAATKAKAHSKLSAITKKVGYPDKWKDYSTLAIGRSSYCENMISAARWEFADELRKLGKPVDRTEWDMTPQTYNAYYNSSNNEIVLPAAVFLVPGVKDADLDDAVIYGYAAAGTIGHEMTHGFDDQGRQFDAKGNLADWWTKDDAANFKKRADVMVQEFNAFEPLPGMHINGAASLGENIADYGGVLLGLDAFKKTEQYKKGEPIAGLNPLQRYFLGYAMGWMDQTRPESLRRQLLSDEHSPSKWRVLGPLSNVPEFYEAFGIKPGQPMWRPEGQRVHIW